VRLAAVVVFAAGYVAGARAGRERYAQILEGMARASEKLEEFSARSAPDGQRPGSGRTDRRS
jgi:hypothetical protein